MNTNIFLISPLNSTVEEQGIEMNNLGIIHLKDTSAGTFTVHTATKSTQSAELHQKLHPSLDETNEGILNERQRELHTPKSVGLEGLNALSEVPRFYITPTHLG